MTTNNTDDEWMHGNFLSVKIKNKYNHCTIQNKVLLPVLLDRIQLVKKNQGLVLSTIVI